MKRIMFIFWIIGRVNSKDGDATFYGNGGAGEKGACMLKPKFNGVPITCAINGNDYKGGSTCGKCVRITGRGEGVGMTPIFGPIFATIDNLCPECKDGDIDLGLGGDGRWRVQWEYIPCEDARRAHRSMLRSNVTFSIMKWSIPYGNYF